MARHSPRPSVSLRSDSIESPLCSASPLDLLVEVLQIQTVTDANGCTITQEIQYLQPPNNESIILMPNPASDNIQIFIKSENPVEEIKIYNAIGIYVKTISDYRSLDLIDISQLSSGVYLAVLSGKSLNYTCKFVKE